MVLQELREELRLVGVDQFLASRSGSLEQPYVPQVQREHFNLTSSGSI